VILTVRLFFRQFPRFKPKIGRFRSLDAHSCLIILLKGGNWAILITLKPYDSASESDFALTTKYLSRENEQYAYKVASGFTCDNAIKQKQVRESSELL